MVALNVVAQLGMQRLIYSMGTMSGGSIVANARYYYSPWPSLVLQHSESFTPEQSGYWLQKLEDEKTRIEGLKNLGKFKEPAVVDAVINLLEQGDWQPDAAYTLGQLGDTRAIPNLIAAIDYAGAPGKSARSRRINKTNINAARALAMLKTDAALDPIVRLTNSSDQNTTQAAIESLGNLGNPGAVKPSR